MLARSEQDVYYEFIGEEMARGMHQPEVLSAQDVTLFQALILAQASTPEGVYGYKLSEGAPDRDKVGVYRTLGRLAERGLLYTQPECSAGARQRLAHHITDSGKQLLAETVMVMLGVVNQVMPVQVVIGETNVESPPLSPSNIPAQTVIAQP